MVDLEFVKFDDKFIEQCHNNFLCQEETAKYTLWRTTKSVEEAKNKLYYWTSSLKQNDIFWLIKEKMSGEIIGFVCAEEVNQNVYGNIGIAIGLNFVKKGYGSQVLKQLIDQIKNQGGKEIHYSHLEGNEASKQLALKFGFKFYKESQRIRNYDNKVFNELFYVLK